MKIIHGLFILCNIVLAARQPINLPPPPYSCNICRDPPTGTRTLVNLNKVFEMTIGDQWTCGYLQETVQDVRSSGGTPGEARFCAVAQYLAYQYCDCIGTSIPSPDDLFKDPNPSCNLCANQKFDFVPAVNKKKLTDTKRFGKHNCDGLYIAAAEGVFNKVACRTIQQNSGKDCCDISLQSLRSRQSIGRRQRP